MRHFRKGDETGPASPSWSVGVGGNGNDAASPMTCAAEIGVGIDVLEPLPGRFGHLLVQRELISRRQLVDALLEQTRSGGPLGAILVGKASWTSAP